METLTKAIFRGQSRKRETDYAGVYLKKKELKTRQCVYISRSMHGTVSRITRMFPDSEITVGSYIDNVLTRHFEQRKRIRTFKNLVEFTKHR
ncbi:MAG: DUF3408 domain-containing protein [Prevotellaceae bacterium]|jgi:hypothetical protein|nr:DUF3408 domain-containing protein [Prevotellaceae bacterium]